MGKSFFLCTEAVEFAITHPRARILYAAPTTKDAEEIVVPLIEQICDSAPNPPKFDRLKAKFVFPNGAQIRLFGCDNKTKANRGRGAGAHLVLVDEAGFIPVLDYVLHSIVTPQTLTTNGRILLASTPSDEPDHPFTSLAEQAEAKGNYIRRTIHDNPRLTQVQIDDYVASDASLLGFTVAEFLESDIYKREFLALRAIDVNLVVCPEWRGGFHVHEKPEFFDAYVSLDTGGIDPHGILFGYWDYKNQWLIIEDELLLRDGESTDVIAERVKQKEGELWGVNSWDGTLRAEQEKRGGVNFPDQKKQPYLRVVDLGSSKMGLKVDGVSFMSTEKTDKRTHVNTVRVMFREGRIKIHPKCKHLDRHLRGTMWLNERQKDYRRKGGEHGDLLDALVYMVRNIRKTKDPYPLVRLGDEDNVWVRPPPKQASMMPDWNGKL